MNVERETRQREWIWEFFLKNCSDGCMIQGLLNAFPFPDHNPHMKRLLLLRLLSLQMAEGTIDSLTLDILRGLGQLSRIEGSHVGESVFYVENKRKMSQVENNEHADLSVEKKRKLSVGRNNEQGGIFDGATRSASPLKVSMLDGNSCSLKVFEQQCRESCELWLMRGKLGLLDDVEKYEKKTLQDMLNSFLTKAWFATGQTFLERVSTDVVNGIYNPVNPIAQRKAGVASEDGKNGKEQAKVKIWNRSSRQFSRSREKLQKTFGISESEFETRNQDDAHTEDVSGKTPIATGGEATNDCVQIREHDVIVEPNPQERERVDEAHEADVAGKLTNTTVDERTSDCVETGGGHNVTGQRALQEREGEDVRYKECLAAKLTIATADERINVCCVTGESLQHEPRPEDEAQEAGVKGKLPVGTVDERISDCVKTQGAHCVTGESPGQEKSEDEGTTNLRSASGLDGQKRVAESYFSEEGLTPLVADVESTKVRDATNKQVVNLVLEFEKSIDQNNVDNGAVHDGAQEATGGAKGATETKERSLEEIGNNERVVMKLQECRSETCSLASSRAPKPSDYMYPSQVRETSTSNNEQGIKEVDGVSKMTALAGEEPLFPHEDAAHMDDPVPPLSPQHQDEIQKDQTEVCFSPPPWVTRPSSPTVHADDGDADHCSKRTSGLVSDDTVANARKEVAGSPETGDLSLDNENIRRNLQRKQTALDAAVQDPLPKILTRSRGRRGLMEPDYTARALEWEDEDDIQSTPKSPSASRRIHLPRADPKNNISPLVGTKATSVNVSPDRAQSRRVPRRWSAREVDTLKVAVKKYGKGRWKLILKHNEDVFQGRTEVDLKDKWRNLERYEGIRVEN